MKQAIVYMLWIYVLKNPFYASEPQTHFTLSKWAYLREGKCSEEVEAGGFQNKSSGSQLRHRGPNNFPGKTISYSFLLLSFCQCIICSANISFMILEACKEPYSAIGGSPIAIDSNVSFFVLPPVDLGLM